MVILAIIVVSGILIFLIALWHLKNHPHYITEFINKNPNRSSIYLIRNDRVILAHNENKLMPLASTVKIIIALEYTNQVSKNAISKEEVVDFALEKSLNQKHFTSFGIKGGSTAFIVTEALYVTDAAGNNTALAVFFNDLKDWERIIIDWNLSKFERSVLFDEKFRNMVTEKLSD